MLDAERWDTLCFPTVEDEAMMMFLFFFFICCFCTLHSRNTPFVLPFEIFGWHIVPYRTLLTTY